jgi:hypothetical protein
VGVTKKGEVQLAEIRLAAGALGLGLRLGKAREEQSHENGDDRNDDQQLHQGEGGPGADESSDRIHELLQSSRNILGFVNDPAGKGMSLPSGRIG